MCFKCRKGQGPMNTYNYKLETRRFNIVKKKKRNRMDNAIPRKHTLATLW